MAISDILQGLGSRPAERDPFAEDLDDPFAADRGQQSGQADLQALTRTWVNERGAAELLP
jgi:GINS complex subunit 4